MHPHEKMAKPNFFKAGSPFLVHPLLTDFRTEQELDFLLSELSLPVGARVLDVGCGFGRHSVALAERGYNVTGIDPSKAMIAAARERADQAGVKVHFRQSRAELFSSREEFDAAICLFTTLGQIAEEKDNRLLIPQVYASLNAGGGFVVEVPQRKVAVQDLKPTEKIGEGDRYTMVSRQYLPSDKIVTESFTKYTPGRIRTFLLAYRLFNRDELTTLLTEAGFKIQAIYGEYARTPLAENSANMLFVAVK